MDASLAGMNLAEIPAEAPPSATVPDFIHPESRGYVLIIVAAICYALMFPIVALRLYLRNWVNRSFAVEDAACLLAVTGTVAYSAVILHSLNLIGRHEWDVPVSAFTPAFLKILILVMEMVYGPAIFFAKLSLFLLYLRLFEPNQWIKVFVYFGILSTLLLYTATTVTFGVLCIPRSGESWLEADFSPRCAKSMVMTYIQGIFNVVSDFYILILPIPVVWNLQMPLRKKIGVSAIFMTGLLACLASTVGLYYRVMLAKNGDFSWREVQVGSLVFMEMSLGVICGCMPYLASLFKRLSPKGFGTSLRHLFSAIVSKFSRSSKHSSSGSNFRHLKSDSSSDAYLETKILGSVKGGGKFLESGVFPQKGWIRHGTVMSQSMQDSTTREKFQD